MPEKKTHEGWLWLVLWAGVLAALLVAALRVATELAAPSPSIVLDLPAWKVLWEGQGLTQEQGLAALKEAGADSIAVSEDTLESLARDGKVTVFSSEDMVNVERRDAEAFLEVRSFVPASALLPKRTFALFTDKILAQQAWSVLSSRLAGSLHAPEIYLHPLKNEAILVLTGKSAGPLSKPFSAKRGGFISPEPDISEMGTGFSPEAWVSYEKAGFSVAVRINNVPPAAAGATAAVLQSFPGKPSLIIFPGESVLGYPSALSVTAGLMSKQGYRLGLMEFSEPRGQVTIVREPGVLRNTVRSHTIPLLEMEGMNWDKAQDRYIRAVRERNVRALVVLPLWSISGNHWTENLKGLGALSAALKKDWFSRQWISWREKYNTAPIRMFCGWGILAALFLFFRGRPLLTLSQKLQTGTFWSIFILWGLVSVVPGLVRSAETGSLLWALLACILFPVWGLLEAQARVEKQGQYSSFHIFLTAIGWTLLGALLTVGVASFPASMLGIKPFIGVKAALLGPFLLAGFYLYRQDPVFARKMDKALTVRDLLLVTGGILLLAVLAFIFLSRSGNNPMIGASGGLEEKIRQFLEKILVARPRTKEILIGFPLLWLAFAFRREDKTSRFRLTGALLLLGGLIGLVSLSNSFCHFHTPLLFTLLRSFNGLWLGSLVGIILIKIIFNYINRKSSSK